MASALKLKNPLIQILHGNIDYYYHLAELNQNIIDKFICISKYGEYLLLKKIRPENFHKIQTEYAVIENIDEEIHKVNLDLSPHEIQICFVGHLSESKGVLLFKDILQILDNNNIEYIFHLIGHGSEEQKLKKDFVNNPRVRFYHEIPNKEVLKHLANGHIFLFPSYSEGMPLSLIEAMKSGCVPVVNDIPGGIQELVIEGETGFKIASNDFKMFASRIINLYQDPFLMNKISENAKMMADRMFHPNVQAKKFEDLYIDISTRYDQNKIFPKYPMGGILNKPYLPNLLVKSIRKIIKHQKI
jgi:glycosyltransferase involved in cell wall biosynthesis